MALAVMPVVPWWAACKALRHVWRRDAGMMTLSPRQMTSSMMAMSARTG